MLVFLAGPARTGRVSRNLAPGCGVGGVRACRSLAAAGRRGSASGSSGTRAGSPKRKFIFASSRIEMMRFHLRKLGSIKRRNVFWPAPLDVHELSGHRFAQPREHMLEHGEALALIFVEGVALAVATQANDLAQMLERH